jgi:hypothetical protein
MNRLSGESVRLRSLAIAVGLLLTAAIDLDDGPAVQACYTTAERLAAELAATPAQTFAGLQVKAELVAWCCASRADFALGETSGERVIASILSDLLASSNANATGTNRLPASGARF